MLRKRIAVGVASILRQSGVTFAGADSRGGTGGQAGVPLAPRNLRILDGNASCGGGLIGTSPNCFPAPPDPLQRVSSGG